MMDGLGNPMPVLSAVIDVIVLAIKFSDGMRDDSCFS